MPDPNNDQIRPKALPAAPDKNRRQYVGEGGEAAPGMEKANIARFGYPSLKRHYIDGPGDMPNTALADLWNVHYKTLSRWISGGNWKAEREERLSHLPEHYGGKRSRSNCSDEWLAEMRANHVEFEIKTIDECIQHHLEGIRGKEEEVTTATGTKKIMKTGGGRKADSSAIRDLLVQRRVALGLPNRFTGSISVGQMQVNMIRETMPAEETTQAYLAETVLEMLPEAEADADEGEIIE